MNRQRARLPNRRTHEIISFEFRGLPYTVGVGRFPDGSLAELFIDCFRGSSPLAADARDAAVALSIALQFGVPTEVIRGAVIREADGQAAGILGRVLDILEAAP
jgi:hypothetical protein